MLKGMDLPIIFNNQDNWAVPLSRRRARSATPGQDLGGFIVDQSSILSVWLGLAVLALVSAQVLLWRTRYLLRKFRQAALAQEVRPAPVVVLVPSLMADSAVSGVAS